MLHRATSPAKAPQAFWLGDTLRWTQLRGCDPLLGSGQLAKWPRSVGQLAKCTRSSGDCWLRVFCRALSPPQMPGLFVGLKSGFSVADRDLHAPRLLRPQSLARSPSWCTSICCAILLSVVGNLSQLNFMLRNVQRHLDRRPTKAAMNVRRAP